MQHAIPIASLGMNSTAQASPQQMMMLMLVLMTMRLNKSILIFQDVVVITSLSIHATAPAYPHKTYVVLSAVPSASGMNLSVVQDPTPAPAAGPGVDHGNVDTEKAPFPRYCAGPPWLLEVLTSTGMDMREVRDAAPPPALAAALSGMKFCSRCGAYVAALPLPQSHSFV